jgi:FMN phosphatase YigB (HAD superfamily)
LRTIIDVDSTLYDFSTPLYQEVIKAAPNFPTPDKWDRWEIETFGFLTRKQLQPIFDKVQSEIEIYPPFVESKALLNYLSKYSEIIIATHRSPKFKVQLLNWLDKHNLPYDDLYVGYDKTTLFNDAHMIIDDAPHTLRKAKEYGILGMALRYPWNDSKDLLLFDTMLEMISYLRKLFEN